MTSNPADVTTTEVAVALLDVEDVLSAHCAANKVTGGGVHDTLGLSGRARGIEKEERVFRVHDFGRNVSGPLLDLFVPPEITSLLHGDLGASTLEDQAAGNVGALVEGVVDNLLGANELATTLALVGGDDNLGARVDDTVTQRIGRETGKDDGMDSTNSDTGKNSNDGLWNHGKVNSDSVALADAHLLEGPGSLADLAEEFRVGNIATILGLVGFVDDGDAVGVLESMAIDKVVAGIELALDEPLVVAAFESAAADSLEIAVPREQFTGMSAPELGGLCDGFLVELLVLLNT